MSHYRDPLAGLRSQVATKRAQLEDRERALSPMLRALLPERLRRAVHDLQPRAQAGGESMEALAGAESALDAILVLYDEAFARAPLLRECEADPPDPPLPTMPSPWLFEEPYLLQVRSALSGRLLAIDPAASVGRWGDFTYLARFRHAAAPFAVVVTAEIARDGELVARHHSSVRTTVPASLGQLEVRLERTHHAVGKALHLVHDAEIGVPAFDDRFWIAGSGLMTALLTPDVRAALERLCEESPVLTVGGGTAIISWSAHWRRVFEEALPDAALDVLLGIRAAIASG